MGTNAELVREFVKDWAWDGREIRHLDQLYILGKQSQLESNLYGKVDFIVTDSPILLSGVYQEYYQGLTYAKEAALEFIRHAEDLGISYKNYHLKRCVPFDPRGRWETEDKAKVLDGLILASAQEAFPSSPPVSVSGSEDVLAHLLGAKV